MSASYETIDFCPVCLADKGFKPESRGNLWERVVLRMVGKGPFRCVACDSRQIRSSRKSQVAESKERADLQSSEGTEGPKRLAEPSTLPDRKENEDFRRLIFEIRRAERAKDQEVFERRR